MIKAATYVHRALNGRRCSLFYSTGQDNADIVNLREGVASVGANVDSLRQKVEEQPAPLEFSVLAQSVQTSFGYWVTRAGATVGFISAGEEQPKGNIAGAEKDRAEAALDMARAQYESKLAGKVHPDPLAFPSVYIRAI